MEDKQIVLDVEQLQMRSGEINPIKENKLVKSIVLDLKNVIRHNNLLGLAAPLIGAQNRIVVLNFNGDLRAFVNPQIVRCEGMILNKETCESLPGKRFVIPRYQRLDIQSFTPTGKLQNCSLSGLAAYVMQHEIDHLDGVFVSDIGLEIDDDFEQLSEEDRDKILMLYLDSIDEKRAQLEEEINADEELRAMRDGMKFIHSIEIGETQLDPDTPFVECKKEEDTDE